MLKHFDKVEKIQALNFTFTGIPNEEVESSIRIDKGWSRIVGIGVVSEFYREPSTIEEATFDGKSVDLFPKGLFSGILQGFDVDYMPCEITNMDLKEVKIKIRDLIATARRVQIFLILDR